ncbi:MAG: TonB-dependent receptor [Ignavibacteriales bacterium]|nr:TonB-dependent receptor [Ignavibacteriales bacterium]
MTIITCPTFAGTQNSMRRAVVVSFATFIVVFGSLAQDHATVWGVVSDAATNQPISQVNITLQNQKSGTSTDSLGKYVLHVTPGVQSIRFSHIGYRVGLSTVTIDVGESLRVDMTLNATSIPLDEVTVIADSLPVSRIRSLGAIVFSPIKLQNISGAFGDIGKSLQIMPGVTSNNEMSSQFNVRGGTMFENLLLLNGIELIEPYHLKESPNTSLGIFNVSLLNRALFVPGGFTARYGDRLSAVVDLEQREGRIDRFGALLDLSLSDVMAVVEGPIAKNGSALLSFRSSYSDFVARYLTDQNQRWPTFYDFNGSVALEPWKGHRLAVQILHSLDQTHGLSEGEYSTTLIGIHGASSINPFLMVHSSLSFSRQYEDLRRSASIVMNDAVNWSRDSARIVLAEAKVHLDAKLSDAYSLATGFRVQSCNYDGIRNESLRIDSIDQFLKGSLDKAVIKTALYAENIVQLTRDLLVNAGLRCDVFSLTHEVKMAPRILVSYQAGERTFLKAASGLYYQTPTYYQLLAANQAGEQPQRMQRAIHYLIGVERTLEKGMRVHAEIYFKQLDALISYARLRSGDFVYSPRNDSRGEIKGVDLEALFSDDRVTGWLSVSWMDAKEVKDGPGEKWHLRPTSQRLTLNFVFEPRLAENWVLSLRSLYGTGFAYANDLPGTKYYQINHYPDYKRIDLRLNYSFEAGRVRSTTFVEITNLFSMRNVLSFQGTLNDPTTPDYTLLLPMIINVGMKFEY